MSNSNQIQILSIDSDAESKLAIQSLLKKISGVEISAEAANSKEAIAAIEHKDIDVALLELNASDANGIDLIKQIRRVKSGVRVLVITASDTPEDIFAAMDAGADGYVMKNNINRALETALRSVRLGAVWLDPDIAKQMLQVIQMQITKPSRILPTGLMTIPLLPDEKSILNEVASSNCVDGVCMLDPDFVKRLRRFAHQPDKSET